MSEFYADDSMTWEARDLNTTSDPTELVISGLEAATRYFVDCAHKDMQKALFHTQEAFDSWLTLYSYIERLKEYKAHKLRNLTWANYCKQILGVDDSRVRQLKKAYPYAVALIKAGITDICESDLRHIPKGITPDNPDLATIFQTARGTMLKLFGSQAAPTAAVYNAVLSVLDDAQATGGYVDTGDGEMTALEAAVATEVQERIYRQQEAIRNGGKWEEVERKVWHYNEPGALGILVSAGMTVDTQDTDIEIVVIVRRAKTDE